MPRSLFCCRSFVQELEHLTNLRGTDISERVILTIQTSERQVARCTH